MSDNSSNDAMSPSSFSHNSQSTENTSAYSRSSLKGSEAEQSENGSRPVAVHPSSTNNLRDDLKPQSMVRGVEEEVTNLTNFLVKDLRFPRQCGGFSDVWKGYLNNQANKEVAIKCPRFSGINWEDDKQRIRRRVAQEISTSSKLSHPNIIKLLGFARVDGCEYDALVMDWCPGKTLHQQLKSSKLSCMEQSTILLQLAAGIAYMHSNDIVHADLKPDNVLVGPQGQIKISDFGLSRIIKNIDPTTSVAHYGAEPYMAPELCGDAVIVKTLCSDVWAFGVVAYQLLEHDVSIEPYAYKGTGRGGIIKRMSAKAEGEPPYQDGQQVSELTTHFMSTIAPCWAADPAARPKMSSTLTTLYEKFIKQDLCETRWDWLFAPTPDTFPKTSIIGGANSDDLVRHSVLKYEQGAYTESRILRAKAAADKLFRGKLFECAEIQKELASSCVGQCDREATLHHYDSAIRKYEHLGSAHVEAAEHCRKIRKESVEGRQFGLWCDLSDPSAMIRRAGDLGEQALDRNDFSTATRCFEELLDIARRDQKRDIMAQACVRLAWACELESRLKLVRAKEYYLEALNHYEGVESAALNQRIIEDDLKRLEGIPVSTPSNEL